MLENATMHVLLFSQLHLISAYAHILNAMMLKITVSDSLFPDVRFASNGIYIYIAKKEQKNPRIIKSSLGEDKKGNRCRKITEKSRGGVEMQQPIKQQPRGGTSGFKKF